MKLSSIVAVGMVGAMVAGCKGKEAEKAPPPPPAAVVVTPVVQRDVPVTQEWIGTTAGNINAEIRPRADGYLLRRVYTEGSFVHQGDVMFEIDPRQVQAQLQQAQGDLAQAQALYSKAEQDVNRFRPLAAQKAVSQQELDNALSAAAAAKAVVDAHEASVHQARLNLGWARVTAPISGIAGASQAQVGDLVSPTSILAVVSQCDPIRVSYQVSEQEYMKAEQKRRQAPAGAADDLDLVLTDGSVFPHKGHVLFADRDVNVKTGTINTVAVFPNPGNLLRPGQFAKIRGITDVKKAALLVPQRAVNELQGGFQVAVVGSDNKAELRPVVPGVRLGTLWQIDSGLKPGEQVVVEGFSRVKAGATVKPEQAPAEQAAAEPSTSAAAPGGK
ncbi:MAG TPA: efflux RND transporter periplasmic adaptor subunit [Thermoanaerobaculia bacterium]|nr:efflux RND transporter periplasmic adaptor subunit [Thermoanaerobaculia bacterium]